MNQTKQRLYRNIKSTQGVSELGPQQDILDRLPIAIYSIDTEGRINYYNKAASDLWGREPELNLEKWCGSLKLFDLDGRQIPLEECPTAIALRTASPVRGQETVVERPDGSQINIVPHPTPLFDAGGKLTGVTNVLFDVTERRRAETALQKNLDIQNTTFNNFPGGISLFDNELYLQSANPAFYRLLDLPEDLFPVGCAYSDIIRYNAERGEYGPGDIEQMVDDRVTLAKKFEQHSFKRMRPGGTSLEIKGWPLPGGGFITIYMDITEIERTFVALEGKTREAMQMAEDLRQAKDTQSQTHQYLLSSVNAMRNGLVIWGADNRLVLANKAFRDFNAPVRDMIKKGLRIEDLLDVGCDKGIWDIGDLTKEEWIAKVLHDRSMIKESEREVQFGDGRQMIFSTSLLENGDTITTIIDVTEHHRRENELRDAKRQLEKVAYFDGLTDLANRAHCQKDLAERFLRGDKSNGFAVIQIDLDNFKKVNDTLGHAAGDHLLRSLGKRLALLSDENPNFKVYRWGGDEFIATVDRTDNTDLKFVCREVTDLVAVPLKLDNATIRPTVSLGVARYPEDAEDLEALMIFADLALYRTKELGRDGFQFFTSEMKEQLDAESQIEDDLRIAIDEGQLELYYQPQIDVHDESLTGFEALLRWRHPTKGVVSPGDFLPVAEASGLAPIIGRQVFDHVTNAIRHWKDNGIIFGRVAVNLSPQHLKQGTLLEDLFGSMERNNVGPESIAVEFLESFLLDDPDADITGVLKELGNRGIHVELDDFGTGYASLAHLSSMPINGLKVDRSFVRQMMNSQKEKAIVSSLISMSKLMNLHVVCEGVETQQQLDAIRQIGACSAQGYFIAKPMPFDQVTQWIEDQQNLKSLRILPKVEIAQSA